MLRVKSRRLTEGRTNDDLLLRLQASRARHGREAGGSAQAVPLLRSQQRESLEAQAGTGRSMRRRELALWGAFVAALTFAVIAGAIGSSSHTVFKTQRVPVGQENLYIRNLDQRDF